MKNYFEVLRIPENSSREDIQKAYRHLAKLYHPDVNKSPDAHERFCEITEAYEFIMNHWPRQTALFRGETLTQEQYEEYATTEAFAKFRQEAREKAHQQARMRYEKFRKQHEAFQQSGINDIALLLTAMIRLLSIVLFLFLLFVPLIMVLTTHWTWILLALFMWPFALIIGWYIRDNRRHYLMPGELYYTPSRIRRLFTDKHPTDVACHYCRGKKANSKPYQLDLLKLKEIKYGSGGYRQHNVNYVNQNISIAIPRSQKAFIIHSVIAGIKILSLIACFLFLNLNSMVWRFIMGIIAGGFLGTLLRLGSGTRSNISYLISYGFLVRVILWLSAIVAVSRFSLHPFDISTNDTVYFAVTAIVVFDSFLMQLVEAVLGKYASAPIIRQHPAAELKFREGFVVYNDVPVLSVIYPLFRWMIG
jgi:hypothetical protein